MPRKPNATSPNANTAGAIISAASPYVLTTYAIDIRITIVMPSQYALKLPATKPERMSSDAAPSRADVTTSRTWLDSTDVKTLTSSGMTAPASVPQATPVAGSRQHAGSPP